MTFDPPPLVMPSWRDATPKDVQRCGCGQPLWAQSSRMLGLCARCCPPENRVLIYDGPPYLVEPPG